MSGQSSIEAFGELQPRAVWKFFGGMAAVPRPSKREERIRKHLREVAEHHGLAVKEDSTGNLVIDVPATEGFADAPITVLQAHVDMVCEKNASTEHDFDTEGIRLIVTTEESTGERIVRGDGTTLGADNGLGVALALAVATSPDVVHGPLELLFTVDEEDGMTGAKALTAESFRGRRMLNLDSEEDDTLCIGCAGGCDTNLSWTLKAAAPAGDEVCKVSVTGLRGGHSGCDIHEGRANAIKLLVRTLLRVSGDSLQLISISGGSKRNAIPREATAVVAGPAGLLGALQTAGAAVAAEAVAESVEPDTSIVAEKVALGTATLAASASDTTTLLRALAALPSGVLGMHPKVPGLVETSNNVSTMSSELRGSSVVVCVGMLSRSSSASRIAETAEQLASIGRLSGAEVATGNEYPGWSPNPESALLAVCRRVYRETFDVDPEVGAIHAGLECGIIGKRVGDMDMVSLGPTIRGAHSPDERAYVSSVERTWRYLVALLEAMARG